MKYFIAASLCLSLMTMCLVKSTPVYPTIQLKHFSPVDMCLFVCNICFDDMVSTEFVPEEWGRGSIFISVSALSFAFLS